MHTLRRVCLFLGVAVLTSSTAVAAEESWSLGSPDGKLVVTVRQADLSEGSAYPSGKRLYYKIEHGAEDDRAEVLGLSPLGIVRSDQAFQEGLELVSAGRIKTIDENYEMPHGKRRVCRNHAREMVLDFKNHSGARMQLVVRAYDEGIAFRYGFPERDETIRTVVEELSGFRIPVGARAWMQPYQQSGQWTPAYEDYYRNGIAAGSTSPEDAGWALPALFKLADGHWVLLAEAMIDGSYCGMRLGKQAPDGLYRFRLPDAAEGNFFGPVKPASRLPWATPWRVIMVGDSLKRIVESTLITDLNPPSVVKEAGWIKPGRVAWSWWSDHDSPRDYRKQCKFVDLAAEMGWEYCLVDANWTLMDHGDVRRLAEYADGKGVGLFLWYNSGGPNNFVTEKPRGCMFDHRVRQNEFELLKRWGIKGLKIDFFHSDKQSMMRKYVEMLRDAIDAQMMINFHGCTIPRGWSRTYPHLMTMESAKGAECYTFAEEFPEKAPWHNTIVAFTRNVIGPVDYTPCAFSHDKYPHLTTNAYELALVVVFETGLIHFADSVEAYRGLPEAPKKLLRDVPAAWDDVRLIDGEPGQFVVIARRKGDQWFVGGINGRNRVKRVEVSLSFLEEQPYDMTLIADGPDKETFATTVGPKTADDRLEVEMRPYGGFVMRLVPQAESR